MVINGETGYVRNNHSWIIGRMVRDFNSWMDKQPRAQGLPPLPPDSSPNPIQDCVNDIIEQKWNELKKRAKKNGKLEPDRPFKAGLCVSVYNAKRATKGYPGYDCPYRVGCATFISQLGVAAIPCILFRDWSILLVTAAGIALSFASGALPQWSKEKWACRTNTKKTLVLTSGNGSQHAIVIQGAGVGLDFEDLAAADTGAFVERGTRWIVIALGVLWILLLISASGITQNAWFLLAVGGMGILDNMYVAGISRPPEAFGVPLEFVEVVGMPKVMDTLFEVEDRKGYAAVARLLIYKGVDVDAQKKDGSTALILALEKGHKAIAQLLIDKGADVNAQKEDGSTALILASEKGYEAIARLLIIKGANVNAQKEDGSMALILALEKGHKAIAQLLIDHGADVRAQNKDGSTALILALDRGYAVVARLLIEKGANVDAQKEDGSTALILALDKGYAAVAQLLINKGADVDA
ncbi:hypothetical protein N0V88_006199 [Collariella sp. IMI 366227]|nr:hypothetical protein N0V88_006199 [Collariella sp. IMI 366227]